MKKRTVILIGGGASILGCIICISIGAIYGSTPEYRATSTARAIAQLTDRARPSLTSAPPTEPQEMQAEGVPAESVPTQGPVRATEVPTQPPAPTPTPRPIAPSFLEIRVNVQSMTEAQWKAYLPTLDGYAVVNWTGWVEDVNVKFGGGYELWIDMDPPSEAMSIYDVVFDIPDDIALQLNRDQQVTFSGTIDHISELFGSITVYLVDPTVQ